MKAIDLLRTALQITDGGINRIVADMHDVALTQPTSKGGNHPLWAIGHMAYVEGWVRQTILGEANPLEHLAPLFAMGSTPVADASAYPSFEEVLHLFREQRARTFALLDEIGDEGLDRAPVAPPPGFEEMMKTVGSTLLLLNLHHMVHYGQIADARRVAGRAPLM